MFVSQKSGSSEMETLLILLLWASLSGAFNLDPDRPLVYNTSPQGFFGYSVQQAGAGDEKHIIVGAPLERNSTGEMYSCTSDLMECTALQRPDSGSVRFFGLSSAVSDSEQTLTSCSPYLPHECDGNSYLNGVCYQFNSSLQSVSNITAAYQECTKREVNLVFMVDGSRSMRKEEFEMNKQFIINITEKLSNSTIKFAAIQFGAKFSTVFDFNDYQNGTAEQKLKAEKHMSALTNTYGAIKYILDNLLNKASSGSNPNAQKALVIITDGNPTDIDIHNITQKCDEQNILRYVIGVGTVDLKMLESLASEPKKSNTFYIQDYRGLEGLLDNLQNKIYNIEGSKKKNSKDRQKELSQSGFSVVHQKDSVILGSVGSNDWSGSLYEVTGSGPGSNTTEITAPAVSQDSYLGYSTVLGKRNGVPLLFSGAPRSEHKGLVSLFIKTENGWLPVRSFPGEQIGSYFGASLSLLDVDSDGDSDFLLVGAPLFHQTQPKAEGRLYVFAILGENYEKTLNVSESNTGRFAASLASLKDLNGDSVSDVAVGAPLENEGEGVVYIYLGDRTRGINPDHTPQRIPGRSVLPGLLQFGVSLSGQMDMSGDNLTDVVIGAQGGVVLLKARPVMSVYAQLSFSPNEISLMDFECPSDGVINAFNLTSCFSVSERTSSTGSLDKALNVSLTLIVDAMRGTNRGFLDESDPRSRTLQQLVQLDSASHCLFFPIFMQRCTKDTVAPLKIIMKYSQTEMMSGNSRAVLDLHSRTEEFVQVPFQRNCNSNSSCVADLRVDFSFTSNKLLVDNQAPFTLLVTLANPGDDSYNTSIALHYPESISYSKISNVDGWKPARISCGDRDGDVMNRTTCSINSPVYRKGSSSQFLVTFMTKWDKDWSDTMEMMISAHSDNNGNTSDPVVKRSIPVHFPVNVAITLDAEFSVMYLNFSLDDRGPKHLSIFYKVKNLGPKGLPVSVTLKLPCQTTHMKIKPQSVVRMDSPQDSPQDSPPDASQNSSVECEARENHCGIFECHQFDLKKYSDVWIIVTADATLQNVKEFEGKHSFHEFRKDLNFNISAELNFNRSLYNQTSSGQNDPHKPQTTVRVEFIIPPSKMVIVGTGAGGGFILLFILLLLLIKCGFFKRKHPEEFPSESKTEVEVTPEGSPLIASDTKENKGVSENDSGEKENGVKETSPSPELSKKDE